MFTYHIHTYNHGNKNVNIRFAHHFFSVFTSWALKKNPTNPIRKGEGWLSFFFNSCSRRHTHTHWFISNTYHHNSGNIPTYISVYINTILKYIFIYAYNLLQHDPVHATFFFDLPKLSNKKERNPSQKLGGVWSRFWCSTRPSAEEETDLYATHIIFICEI